MVACWDTIAPFSLATNVWLSFDIFTTYPSIPSLPSEPSVPSVPSITFTRVIVSLKLPAVIVTFITLLFVKLLTDKILEFPLPLNVTLGLVLQVIESLKFCCNAVNVTAEVSLGVLLLLKAIACLLADNDNSLASSPVLPIRAKA